MAKLALAAGIAAYNIISAPGDGDSDYIKFLKKGSAVGFHYDKRDSAPSLEDIRAAQESIMTTFEAFKQKNDERLDEIAKKGSEDVVAREHVERIETELVALKEIRDELDKLQKRLARPGGTREGGQEFTQDQVEHRNAFLTFIRNPDDHSAKAALEDIQKRAVQTTTDTAGGFAVPEIISARVERELAEISPLRNIVDVQQAGSKDFKILVDVRGLAYAWVGETTARTDKATPLLEEVAPTFGTIYSYPKATEESMDDMFFNVETWLVNSILEGFAAGEENAIVNGDGTNKPTGILNGTPVATADGARAFGVLQYIASGNAALVNDPDTFVDVIQSIKKGYRTNGMWLMNKLTAGVSMKLKDGDGNYLWSMGNIANQTPDRLWGYPVVESEEMPDIAANAFPIAFGDFSAGYILADLVGFRLTRDEITEPGYVKWYARRRLGGKVKKSEAIKLIKVATT